MRILFFAKLLIRGIFDLGKCLALAAVALLAILGGLVVADCADPPDLPTIRGVTRVSWHRGLTQAEISSSSDGQLWEAAMPALWSLDDICPEVSAWIRERHATGMLRFDHGDRRWFARYHMALHIVEINDAAFMQDSDELACTIAHEYRHSRQSLLRGVQASLLRPFGIDRADMVEDEARAFEGQIRRALHGGKP